MTGFLVFDYEIAAKWLELLKEIAPSVTRVGVIREPTNTGGIGQLAAILSAARLSRVEVIPVGGQDSKDIERTVTEFARGSNYGLMALGTPLNYRNSNLIITLAARHRLPATYPARSFVADGGLISYGPDPIDTHRQAAGYVDRILKGEKPADLPVHAPTKYQRVINLKTAKTLGLDAAVAPCPRRRGDRVAAVLYTDAAAKRGSLRQASMKPADPQSAAQAGVSIDLVLATGAATLCHRAKTTRSASCRPG